MDNIQRNPQNKEVLRLVEIFGNTNSYDARHALYDVVTALRGPDEGNPDAKALKAVTILLRSYLGIDNFNSFPGWSLYDWDSIDIVGKGQNRRAAASYKAFLVHLKRMIDQLSNGYTKPHVEQHLREAVNAIGAEELMRFARSYGREHCLS